MNKFSVDEQLKQTFLQYRLYLVPAVVIGTCFLLVSNVVMPQFQSWLSLEKKLAEDKARLGVMTKNLQLLSSLDEQTLDAKLTLVAAALPSDKDLYGIVTAVNRAGITSGAVVGDYSFSGSSSQQSDTGGAGKSADKGNQSVNLTLIVAGNIDTIKRFITEIKHQLPLADISSARIAEGGSGSTVELLFYYKDFPKLAFASDKALQNLSASEDELINQINEFEHDTSADVDVNILSK